MSGIFRKMSGILDPRILPFISSDFRALKLYALESFRFLKFFLISPKITLSLPMNHVMINNQSNPSDRMLPLIFLRAKALLQIAHGSESVCQFPKKFGNSSVPLLSINIVRDKG